MSAYINRRALALKLAKVDASRPLRLEVTAGDIKGAKQKDSAHCAFARACTRSQNVNAAYFFKSTAWLEYKDRMVRYILPNSVQKEIVSFDRSMIMEPGIYHLAKPQKARTRKAIRARWKKNPGKAGSGKKRIGRILRHATTNVRGRYEPAS